MKGLDALAGTHSLDIGTLIGYSHPFLMLNVDTVIHTFVIIGIIVALILIAHILVRYTSTGKFIVIQTIKGIMQLIREALGYFSFEHCAFIGALFIFIALSNIAPIIPLLEEPTKDLNTTLALGLVSFIYTQIAAIKHQGVTSYIYNEYFSPFFLMLPLHILGKIASIISISFRLFGNIFGGAIITQIYTATLSYSIIYQLIGLLSGINFIIIGFFIIFEGLLQAFVFTMLTLTYLSISLQEDHE